MKKVLLTFFFLISINVIGQVCTNPGQTVQTTFPVCGNAIFTQNVVPPCTGISTPNCSASNNNPYFYKFTIYATGTLGFVITPFNLSSDYDFQLFNVTNVANLTDIYTNGALLKTGNISVNPGATGCIPAGINIVCGAGSPYNALQNVVAGEKYILLVANFNNGATGYTLNFTGGTASISNTIPIDFVNAIPNCSNNKVTVKLNRPIKCTSLAADGSDFVLSPAGATIVSAFAPSCAAGEFTTDSIILNLSASLPANTYTITMQNGTDGNPVLGICDDPMGIGKTVIFTASPPSIPPKFLSLSTIPCNPTKIKFQLSKPVLCDSITLSGSDFEITGSSAVNVTGASFACSGAPSVTSEIELTLASPITTGGSYLLKAKNGTDNNTLVDACGLKQVLTDNIGFTIAGTVDANFNFNIGFGCVKDTVVFSHAGVAVANWSWDFGDPASGTFNTSASQNPTHIFTDFGLKDVKLTVTNASCTSVVVKQVNLNNQIQSGFTVSPKDSVCLNSPLTFTSTATGNNLTHAWDFGNGQNSIVQNPPAVNYLAPNNYNVTYTIKNNFNCSVVVQKPIVVLPTPGASVTSDKNKICEKDVVMFTASNSGGVSSFNWDFGDGNSTTTVSNPMHIYNTAGNFIASYTASNQFCGSGKKDLPIKVIAIPTIQLGEDLVLCPSKKIILNEGGNTSFLYNWNTGETTPSIQFVALQPAQIKVLVTNDICTAKDSLNISVLQTCNIYVPNAFTPNADGKNDVFKVLNADLAKEFNLEIFNRYGEKIFVSNDANIGWEGNTKTTLSQAGAYIWILKYKDATNNKSILLKGTVLLVR
jgi:gliding motility-associated-like protein